MSESPVGFRVAATRQNGCVGVGGALRTGTGQRPFTVSAIVMVVWGSDRLARLSHVVATAGKLARKIAMASGAFGKQDNTGSTPPPRSPSAPFGGPAPIVSARLGGFKDNPGATAALHAKMTRLGVYVEELPESVRTNWSTIVLMVGAGRFERPTPCAQGRCATRLRYAPTFDGLFIVKHFPYFRPPKSAKSPPTVAKPSQNPIS